MEVFRFKPVDCLSVELGPVTRNHTSEQMELMNEAFHCINCFAGVSFLLAVGYYALAASVLLSAIWHDSPIRYMYVKSWSEVWDTYEISGSGIGAGPSGFSCLSDTSDHDAI